jgi:hypothetical protein
MNLCYCINSTAFSTALCEKEVSFFFIKFHDDIVKTWPDFCFMIVLVVMSVLRCQITKVFFIIFVNYSYNFILKEHIFNRYSMGLASIEY